jgi:hypothetical protein
MIATGQFPTLARPVSRLMAAPPSDSDNFESALDTYWQAGGNALYLHGEGGEVRSRQSTGRWLRDNRLRDAFWWRG